MFFYLQIMQVTYGIATSTEVAYFTYIYAKVLQLIFIIIVIIIIISKPV